MTKKEEATAIRAMKNAPYFKEFFGESDIEQMAQNVENDFPIELNCKLNKKSEVLEQEIVKLNDENKKEMFDFCYKLIKKIDFGLDEDDIYLMVEEKIGKDAIIKYKHKEGLGFTNAELDYLVSKI